MLWMGFVLLNYNFSIDTYTVVIEVPLSLASSGNISAPTTQGNGPNPNDTAAI